MTTLGDILLSHYASATSYADLAVVAAVEELERHADAQPDLVGRVELAMIQAGNVSIPWRHIDEYRQLVRRLEEGI